MRSHLPVAAAIAVLTLIGFFQFPGHTYLQSDTQIYIPMLERLENPQALAKDLVATRPHMTFTIYDEVTLGLRRMTGAAFRDVLAAQQLVFRALGILGAFLIGTSLGLGRWPALAVASLFSLGATVLGPTVLTSEYEPVPRGFALPLLIFAVGLAAHGRDFGAGAAASLAFLYHPPTTFVFWAVYSALTLWPSRPDWMIRRIRGLAPLAVAVLIMFALSRLHTGAAETQVLVNRIDPAWEQLQRMRAPYNWVSLWIGTLWQQYAILWLIAMAAVWRLRAHLSPELRCFAIGLPLAGALSVPASYFLLERLKLALIPQFQPARAVLFITVFAVVMSAAAGFKAAAQGRLREAMLWLVPAFAVPLSPRLLEFQLPDLRRLMLAAVCAAALAAAARWNRFPAAVMPVALAAFWLIPAAGGIRNYPELHTPELAQLVEWARNSTPPEAVFLFPDAGRDLYPGIFRAQAVRAVWVCWKSGGQVNFMRGLALEWGERWRRMRTGKLDYSVADYLVFRSANRLPDRTPVYENSQFVAYAARP